jgi:hypothetical protein
MESAIVELWQRALRGEFNQLPQEHEPQQFVGIALADRVTSYRYDAARAYQCWLKTGNPELGGR